jgi:hypothetical protein
MKKGNINLLFADFPEGLLEIMHIWAFYYVHVLKIQFVAAKLELRAGLCHN